MIKLGLTGSIGMGKSTALKMFEAQNIPIISADIIVEDLYSSNNEGVKEITKLSPECVIDGNVDKNCLSDKIKKNPELLKKIEARIHPLVSKKRELFINKNKAKKSWLVVLEIPLLFETEMQKLFDYVLVVSCSEEVQKRRVMRRENMDLKKFNYIISNQMPILDKEKLADFVIDTSSTISKTNEKINELICYLRNIRDNKNVELRKTF